MKNISYIPSWKFNKENNKPAVKQSVLMFTTHGIAEGEWNGLEWTQYRWSCKVKDSDVLYWMHLEDLMRLEKESFFLQQEQPEVDLDEEIRSMWEKCNPTDEGMGLESANIVNEQFDYIARHFYELARLKYEK